MSNADPEEVVVVGRDGVTVKKSFAPDEFPVPAIKFLFEVDRNESVSVTMTDTVPEDVPIEDIGFHPEFGADHWIVDDDTIVFERDLDPVEEYVTVYGLRSGDAADPGRFLTEPTIADVSPPLEGSDRVIRDVLGGEDGDSEPVDGEDVQIVDDADDEGWEVDGSTDADLEDAISEVDPDLNADSTSEEPGPEQPETSVESTPKSTKIELPDEVDLDSDAAEESTSIADDTDAEDEEPTMDAATAPGGTESTDRIDEDTNLVAELAAEIQQGAVAEEDLAVLREALGGTDQSNSVDARLEHLQSQVADLAAYTAALEDFLDENGDAQTVIREAKEDFAAAMERLDAVEESVEETEATVAETVDRVDATFEELDADVEDRLGEVDDFVADAEARVADAVDDVDSRIATAVEEQLDSVWSDLDDVAADHSELAEELGDLRGELEALDESTADAEVQDRVEDLETDIESLEADLEELAEMRERLSSAFAGMIEDSNDDSDT